jgi:hypothetical protein
VVKSSPFSEQSLLPFPGHLTFVIVGTPSPILYAVTNILRAIVQICLGEHHIVVANSLSSLSEQATTSQAVAVQPVVVVSDYPSPSFLDMILAAEIPLVICADDFTTIAHYSIAARDMSGVTAARFAMMGLVNIERAFVSSPSHSLVVKSSFEMNQIIKDLCKLYNLALSDEYLLKIFSYLGTAGALPMELSEYIKRSFPSCAHVRQLLDDRSPLENELIDFAAGQYDRIVEGQPLCELEWPTYALLRPEFPDRLTIGSIDLTGPARFIYYGPYFALSPGVWNAEIAVEVQDCLSDNRIAIDIFSDEVLAQINTKLPARGVYGCEIRFVVSDASKPIEVRVQLLTGAIEGLFLVRSIHLSRLASPAIGGEGSAAA